MSNQKILTHCFAVLVDNQPGVLARVVGMFAGRGYNIESLTVDKVDDKENLSRITIVSRGTLTVLDQITAQLRRLMPVRKVLNLTEDGKFVESSLALLKVSGDAKQRAKATAIAKKAGASEVSKTKNTVVFETSGKPEDINKLISSLRPVGLIEVVRSGSVAIGCGDKTILQVH